MMRWKNGIEDRGSSVVFQAFFTEVSEAQSFQISLVSLLNAFLYAFQISCKFPLTPLNDCSKENFFSSAPHGKSIN